MFFIYLLLLTVNKDVYIYIGRQVVPNTWGNNRKIPVGDSWELESLTGGTALPGETIDDRSINSKSCPVKQKLKVIAKSILVVQHQPWCMCADIFVGQLRSTLTCSRCGHTSNTFEPFIDLSLPIKKVQMLFYLTISISVIHCFIGRGNARFRWSEVLSYIGCIWQHFVSGDLASILCKEETIHSLKQFLSISPFIQSHK